MAAVIKRVERTAFLASRALDYATVEELIRETGQPPERWPLVVMKELVDNALDACEEAKPPVAPSITVRVDDGGIEVADNGPGLPPAIVAGVVDLERRVSSRAAYVAPDRGAQGNALKTLIAMPFVLGDGSPGEVTIIAHGVRHRITFGLDALRQRPEVRLVSEAVSVRSGTSVRVHWPRSACLLNPYRCRSRSLPARPLLHRPQPAPGAGVQRLRGQARGGGVRSELDEVEAVAADLRALVHARATMTRTRGGRRRGPSATSWRCSMA